MKFKNLNKWMAMLLAVLSVVATLVCYAGGGDGSTTASSVNVTTATVSTNAGIVTLIAANPNRVGIRIINEAGSTNLTVGFNSDLVYSKGYSNVAAAGALDFSGSPPCPQGAIYAVTGGAVTNTVRIIEFVK